MKGNDRCGEIEMPEDLVEALGENREAAAIWDELPAGSCCGRPRQPGRTGRRYRCLAMSISR